MGILDLGVKVSKNYDVGEILCRKRGVVSG